jgi:hypothetical protein
MAKAPNYTVEQETVMSEMYTAVRGESEAKRAEIVAEIAAMFNKSPASVRAKLSRMQIYIPKVAVSKVTGGEAAKKDELAAKLVKVSGLNLISAEKLNKTDLVALIAFAEVAQDAAQEAAEGFDPTEETAEA